jgi:SDR family mycofactocin-dependent oxidoreductase
MTRPRSTTSSRTRLARQRSRMPSGPRARGVVLVTGAARGIGAATVRKLSAEGWNVIAVDRCADDPRLPYALGTVAELQALANERVVCIPCDVCDADALAGAVEIAERRWGGLDAIVAAAGVIAGGVPAWELDVEQERAVLEVNLGGVLTAARVGIPALLRRPEPRAGRFIAVASTAATRGLPMLAAYCASKAGVTGLIRALAVELAGTGITANAVSPGSTRTPILDESARLYGMESAEDFAVQQPLGRLLEPEEVAALIAWLAGPQSGAATGGIYPLDGGLAL